MTYRYSDWEGEHIELVADGESGGKMAVRKRDMPFVAEIMEGADDDVFGRVVIEDVDEGRRLVDALEMVLDVDVNLWPDVRDVQPDTVRQLVRNIQRELDEK